MWLLCWYYCKATVTELLESKILATHHVYSTFPFQFCDPLWVWIFPNGKRVYPTSFCPDSSTHSPGSTLKFLKTWRESFGIQKIVWCRKGLWMWAAGCGQGSSDSQVCRLTFLFSWCEALKVILVCFERQLGSQWYWLSLQVKEMALRKVGGLALWDFLDFIVRTRIPIFVLLRPFIQCKVWCVSVCTSPLGSDKPHKRAALQIKAGWQQQLWGICSNQSSQ